MIPDKTETDFGMLRGWAKPFHKCSLQRGVISIPAHSSIISILGPQEPLPGPKEFYKYSWLSSHRYDRQGGMSKHNWVSRLLHVTKNIRKSCNLAEESSKNVQPFRRAIYTVWCRRDSRSFLEAEKKGCKIIAYKKNFCNCSENLLLSSFIKLKSFSTFFFFW